MPTQHQRISVTCTPQLSEALKKVEPLVGKKRGGTLVRELAIEGAKATLRKEHAQTQARSRLAELSTQEDFLDWEVLERTDQFGWVEPSG